MTLFSVRLFHHPAPKDFPKAWFPSNQSRSEQKVERHRQQAVEHLREVRADYMERRIFF